MTNASALASAEYGPIFESLSAATAAISASTEGLAAAQKASSAYRVAKAKAIAYYEQAKAAMTVVHDKSKMAAEASQSSWQEAEARLNASLQAAMATQASPTAPPGSFLALPRAQGIEALEKEVKFLQRLEQEQRELPMDAPVNLTENTVAAENAAKEAASAAEAASEALAGYREAESLALEAAKKGLEAAKEVNDNIHLSMNLSESADEQLLKSAAAEAEFLYGKPAGESSTEAPSAAPDGESEYWTTTSPPQAAPEAPKVVEAATTQAPSLQFWTTTTSAGVEKAAAEAPDGQQLAIVVGMGVVALALMLWCMNRG